MSNPNSQNIDAPLGYSVGLTILMLLKHMLRAIPQFIKNKFYALFRNTGMAAAVVGEIASVQSPGEE